MIQTILVRREQDTVKVSDLDLGDVVQCFEGAFGTAVVTQVRADDVMVFRPYATTEDFSHSGGVTALIGIEQFPIWKTQEIVRLQKADPKR